MATTDFTALTYEGERIEDGVKAGRISNHGKLKTQIEESFLKSYEEGKTSGVTQEGKDAHTIEFHKKRREDGGKK